jgi:hypothetical protein
MPNSKHLTHGISNLVSLITKTKLGLSITKPINSYQVSPLSRAFYFSLSSFPNEELDHHHISNTTTFGLQLLHHLD